MKGNNLEAEARNLTSEAELGGPDRLSQVNKELQIAMDTNSGSDYKTILDIMHRFNVKDVEQNFKLPVLEFYSTGGGGMVPDSVRVRYPTGEVVSGNVKPKQAVAMEPTQPPRQ